MAWRDRVVICVRNKSEVLRAARDLAAFCGDE